MVRTRSVTRRWFPRDRRRLDRRRRGNQRYRNSRGQHHGFKWLARGLCLDAEPCRIPPGRYSADGGSVAIAINHSGTLIVGNSGKLLEDHITMRVTPLVWTSKVVWNEGRPTLSWDMHALPTGGWEKPGAVFPGVTLNFWGGWGVNDLGQIAGDGWTAGLPTKTATTGKSP